MSSENDSANKSEEPTEKKLKDARKKGDVPSSREPSNLMGVLSLSIFAIFLAPYVLTSLTDVLGEAFLAAAHFKIGTDNTGLRDLGATAGTMVISSVKLLIPITVLMIAASILGVLVQGETVATTERIRPKLSKISPLSGFKRIYSADAFVEFLKNFTKVCVIVGLSFWFGRDAVVGIWQSSDFIPESFLSYGYKAAVYTLIGTTVLLAFTATTDVIWKRSQWLKKQRMTTREIKDEFKDSEGDPVIKAKRASIRRKRSSQSLVQAVPTASVVITNPTHYAVALRYEMGQDAGPVCVAKGMDRIAAQIRKLAREADVPIVESRALARTIHATVEVDEMVPVEHWRAVAEIISYVIRLRRDLSARPPVGSRLRIED